MPFPKPQNRQFSDMSPPVDSQFLTHALLCYDDIKNHLMTWEAFEDYAKGDVSFVASLSTTGDIVMQGIVDPERKQKISGQFLRLDFYDYWVIRPFQAGPSGYTMSTRQYKERMANWFELIPMLPFERQALLKKLHTVLALDHFSFRDFGDLLLSNPITAYEIRCDLVSYLCSPHDLAELLANAKQLISENSKGRSANKKDKHRH